MSDREFLRAIERETRQLSIDLGWHDFLSGQILFCVLAMRLHGVTRDKIFATVPIGPKAAGYIYPGARCPSFAGPIRIAEAVAAGEGRPLNEGDLWIGLRRHNPGEFRELCALFSLPHQEARPDVGGS